MASSLNGTGLTFSSGSTLNSPPVTSIATGNGLTGGTITTTGTLVIAAPAALSVGSYVTVELSTAITSPTSFSVGTKCAGSFLQVYNSVKTADGCGGFFWSHPAGPALSGTWMCLGSSLQSQMLFVRTA